MKTVIKLGAVVLVAAAAGMFLMRNSGPQSETQTASTPPAEAEPVNGVDVSHYQGDVDWAQVAAAGYAFAFVKAAQGDSGGDSEFDRNWQDMKTAGILRGAYDFYDVGQNPTTQARNFISKVTLIKGDLPPVVDIETMNGSSESNNHMIADLHSYLKTLKDHYGVAPIIYTGPSFWNAHFDDSFSDYALWVAEYGVSKPKAVTGWTVWSFWQYSTNGDVPGINGDVDLDRFNGGLDQLRKFLIK